MGYVDSFEMRAILKKEEDLKSLLKVLEEYENDSSDAIYSVYGSVRQKSKNRFVARIAGETSGDALSYAISSMVDKHPDIDIEAIIIHDGYPSSEYFFIKNGKRISETHAEHVSYDLDRESHVESFLEEFPDHKVAKMIKEGAKRIPPGVIPNPPPWGKDGHGSLEPVFKIW